VGAAGESDSAFGLRRGRNDVCAERERAGVWIVLVGPRSVKGPTRGGHGGRERLAQEVRGAAYGRYGSDE